MSKKTFDLGAMIANGNVPNLGTKERREQIEYINIDLIDDDPNNFYELSNIDELAANIELLGLQQPLRVRANPENPDHVIITSGHRRRAAIRKLVDEGKEDLAEIPCIREVPAESAALQELRLIYANSDTRKMTAADISKQAERVEQLLYQLKEEGMEFPGRMRDHVAEACKVSKSKLARLKVIRDKLIMEWRPDYEKGNLSENVAYILAQMPGDHQKVIYDGLKKKNTQIRWFYAYEAENYGKKLAAIDELICKRGPRKGLPCNNIEAKRNQAVYQSHHYNSSSCSKCCDKCESLATCKNACPLLADKVKRLRASKKDQKRQETLAKEERERPTIQKIQRYWNRFGEARNAADKSVQQCYKALGRYYSKSDDEKVVNLECLEAKFTVDTSLPYGYHCQLSDVEHYVKIADLFGCTLDYLLCRTDDPKGIAVQAPAEGWLPLRWIPGNERPEKDGQKAVAYFLLEGESEHIQSIVQWDAATNRWKFQDIDATIDAECAKWWPLPEDREELHGDS